MFSGVVRHLPATAFSVALLSAALFAGGNARADSQDDKFLDLLGENGVGAVDGQDSLIATGHKACTRLDGGMSASDLVELIRNNGFNDNPLARLYPQRRITANIDRFLRAAVQAYCPYDEGKIADLAAYHEHSSPAVALTSLVHVIPTGEIPPTKPLPVPALPPPAPPPAEEIPAPVQQPPPPPKHVPKAPPKQPQVEPAPEAPQPAPPQEAPPQEAPPQQAPPAVEAPQAPAPAPAPTPTPAPTPPPEPPSPPGHIRLAP
jgi:hypothetical protein